VVQETVEQADRGGVFGQEPAPLVEGPVGADAQGAAFVGGGNEPEQQLRAVSSSGAKPSSSTMTRSLRSRVSITRPTELSARPR
jgi:hypothetical protein